MLTLNIASDNPLSPTPAPTPAPLNVRNDNPRPETPRLFVGTPPRRPVGTPPRSPVGQFFAPPQEGPISRGETTFNGQTVLLYSYAPSQHDRRTIERRKMHPQFALNCKKLQRLSYEEASRSAIGHKDKPGYISNCFDEEYNVLQNGVHVKLFRFVITAQGELICGSSLPDEYYSHEQLASGGLVIAAGEFGFNEKGHLLYINNKTGHYRVPYEVISDVVFPYMNKIQQDAGINDVVITVEEFDKKRLRAFRSEESADDSKFCKRIKI